MSDVAFWNTNARMAEYAQPHERMATSYEESGLVATQPSLKRKAFTQDPLLDLKSDSTKRRRPDPDVATPPHTPDSKQSEEVRSSPPAQSTQSSQAIDRIVDIINQQFGTEILLRHQELRFINQEFAKCQVALEQLRRCHLIPYPTTCPTPQQMLDIVDGKLPAVQGVNGGSTPQWAPPYGVVDGPYARHYAKWLIPDPKFDGQVPEWQVVPAATRLVEGRSTRNSQSEGMTIGKRVARGQVAQKMPAPVAVPKTKGPCILKRSDGVTVKLFCHLEKSDGTRCDRDDFSSTQGFINHVRITHKKDFKSHDEAAFFCGVPVTGDESVPIRNEEKAAAVQPVVPSSGVAHPLTRADAPNDNAYKNILQRIEESIKLYKQGRLPGVTSIPGASHRASSAGAIRKSVGGFVVSNGFVGSSATPFLNQLLQDRRVEVDLRSQVREATKPDGFDSDDWDTDDDTPLLPNLPGDTTEEDDDIVPHRGSGMRLPSRSNVSAPAPDTSASGSKGRSSQLPLLATTSGVSSAALATIDEDASSVGEPNIMDIDRSPNTATSNGMPPLVFDAESGDDSDDQSLSGDASDAEVPKIAEDDIEDVEMQDSLSPHAGSASSGSQKKDESRHVNIVTSVTNKTAAQRKAKAPAQHKPVP